MVRLQQKKVGYHLILWSIGNQENLSFISHQKQNNCLTFLHSYLAADWLQGIFYALINSWHLFGCGL